MLIPLSFFPKVLQTVAKMLPFSYMSYAPSYMLINFSISNAVMTILAQLAWVVVLAAAAFGLYNLGARKVSINGG